MIPLLVIGGCDGSHHALPSPSSGASGVNLNWVAPSEYEDGSFLRLSELDEFRIYVNQKLAAVVDGHVTKLFLELPEGQWIVSMSSVARGVEGPPTDPLLVEIPESAIRLRTRE